MQNPRCDFHFPSSSQERISPAWLAGVSDRTLWEARNEIMARHGYVFDTPRAVQYFSAKPYYQPRTKNVRLSEIEKYNVNLIKSFEGRASGSPTAAVPSTTQTVVSGLDPNGDGFLAVRNGPGSQFRQIGKLLEGDQVVILDSSGVWRKVRFWGGEGWSHNNWIRVARSAPSAAVRVASADRSESAATREVQILRRDIGAMTQQLSELTEHMQDMRGSARGEDPAAEERYAELVERKQEAERAVAQYQTPVRPADANVEANARQASEQFQKVPYFIPGTSTIGEVWIEPVVNDQGQLAFNWNFVDPGAEYQKIAVAIPMTPTQVDETANALRKIVSWSVTAQENKVRRAYEKLAYCFPADLCEAEEAAGARTSLVFRIAEDGSTASIVRRQQGAFQRTFGFSSESAVVLADYLERVLTDSSAEFKGATASQSDLDALFE
ncbi:YARHG domain-containing protein [Aureimonas sp. OT7]|nr:YARHG domain-containing protein [Aureimonas sp. OT7]